nr:hypothetical protein [Elusimicrobiaceae bacterium]
MKNSGNIFNKYLHLTLSVFGVFYFVIFTANVFAQTAMVTNNFVYFDNSGNDNNFQCIMNPFPSVDGTYNRSFWTTPLSFVNSSDPWVNSALIEFDNIDPSVGITQHYPSHCLTLCSEVTCSNPVRQVEMSSGSSGNDTTIKPVGSGDFPIQSILFDIFKYQAGANPYSADSTPPIRTIAMYPDGTNVDNVCRGVPTCCDVPSDTTLTTYSCEKNPEYSKSCCDVCNWSTGECSKNSSSGKNTCGETQDCSGIFDKFADKPSCQAGITRLHFCTAWDGSYEIDGEFGKSNGQFGYRTTIKTNYPGDGISIASDVNIEHMIVYPGDSQIPIQVDVTNVHSVRSSPTLVGKSPAVISQPYRIRYRLSKDALTKINIMDPDNEEIKRRLVDWQPRDGEGFQGGAQSDIQITNEDAWDGRDDDGRLLPYGNYLVNIQAKSKDEWTGTSADDLSRAVTRQLSLDPLKITDIVANGLNKQSTSYAMLNYMLTEAATVHLEIYTPGTTFDDLNICSKISATDCTSAIYPSSGTANPVPQNGLRVASYTEQKAGRVNVNSKWDGMCWDEKNCQKSESSTGSGTTNTGY